MDYSKEYFPLSHLILWRKHWYEWTGDSYESKMKDIREMLKYDGYEIQFMTDEDIFNIIINKYDEYVIWAIKNDIPGFYNPISSVVNGTYHNIGKKQEYPFKYLMVCEILAKLAWINNEYLKLKCPVYDKKHYKIGGAYKPGMTYKQMNDKAKQHFNS